MTASIHITRHAAERIAERIAPHLECRAQAEPLVEELVLDAVWNHRWRRSAPSWARCAVLGRGIPMRYVTGRIGGLRVLAVVALEPGQLPALVTVLTDRSLALRALPPMPEMADGRVIGLPRSRPLPLAFDRIAA